MVSGGKVNWLIDGFCGKGLPAIDLAHVDLSRGEQRPEQHRGGVGRRQHGLGLDPSLELLVQPLDGIGGAQAAPLARRQAREGEQAVSCLLPAVGNGAMLQPPFADEALAANGYLLRCGLMNHFVVFPADLSAQPPPATSSPASYSY